MIYKNVLLASCMILLFAPFGEVGAQAVSTNHASETDEANGKTQPEAEKAKSSSSITQGATPPNPASLVPEPDLVKTVIWTKYNEFGNGNDLKSMVANYLSRFDAPTPERASHFRWLKDDPYFRKIRGRTSGWIGMLLDVKALPNDGWIATVRF